MCVGRNEGRGWKCCTGQYRLTKAGLELIIPLSDTVRSTKFVLYLLPSTMACCTVYRPHTGRVTRRRTTQSSSQIGETEKLSACSAALDFRLATYPKSFVHEASQESKNKRAERTYEPSRPTTRRMAGTNYRHYPMNFVIQIDSTVQ